MRQGKETDEIWDFTCAHDGIPFGVGESKVWGPQISYNAYIMGKNLSASNAYIMGRREYKTKKIITIFVVGETFD